MESITSGLLEQGILGLVAAMFAAAIVYLFKQNQNLQEAKTNDAKEYATELLKVSLEGQKLVHMLHEMLTSRNGNSRRHGPRSGAPPPT